MSALKNIIRMFGPASGVMFELWRKISHQKLANAWLVLRYIGLGWLSAYYHGHILAKQEAYFKALGGDTSIFS